MDRYAEEFLQLITVLPPVKVQNILLTTTDRNLGIIFSRIPEEQKPKIFDYLSPEKERRVREESARQERQYFDYSQYVNTVCHVISCLKSGRRQPPLRSYLRPRRR
ncbi:MAG: hypothetical protein ACLFST_14375 [Spirochaetia bacterium]